LNPIKHLLKSKSNFEGENQRTDNFPFSDKIAQILCVDIRRWQKFRNVN